MGRKEVDSEAESAEAVQVVPAFLAGREMDYMQPTRMYTSSPRPYTSISHGKINFAIAPIGCFLLQIFLKSTVSVLAYLIYKNILSKSIDKNASICYNHFHDRLRLKSLSRSLTCQIDNPIVCRIDSMMKYTVRSMR